MPLYGFHFVIHVLWYRDSSCFCFYSGQCKNCNTKGESHRILLYKIIYSQKCRQHL